MTAPIDHPNSPEGLLGKGPCSVSLTVEKGYENGNNTDKMTFKGSHNPNGGVAEFKHAATRDEFLIPKTKPEAVIHGSPKDQWSFHVEPEPPANGKIKWVVRASHVVPEPSAIAAVAATGLLIFGVIRRVRARPAGN